MGDEESSIYIQCKWNWIKNFIHFFMKCQIKKLIGVWNELKHDEEQIKQKTPHYFLIAGHINLIGIIKVGFI